MELENIKHLKEFNSETFYQVRYYFTKGSLNDSGISSHPDVEGYIVDEINDLTKLLDEYLKYRYSLYGDFFNIDYHKHSIRNCYTLSSLFCLSNPTWYLEQGLFLFSHDNNIFRHSWLEKDDVIYDPAFNVITLNSLYKEFFVTKYYYTREELKKLFRRTNSFTYYEEDLQSGCVNPIGKKMYYNTERAKLNADYFLDDLNQFLLQKVKVKKP